MEEDTLIEKLVNLEKLDEFRAWREMIVKPFLKQLENELKTPDAMSEVILRTKLNSFNIVNDLFYTVFNQSKEQKVLMAKEKLNEKKGE